MKCPNQAFYRFTWPGEDESFICTEHVNKLRGVASAMGFYLQIADLSHDEKAQRTCNQEISGGSATCACKFPGIDSNNPAICPTCHNPHRR